MGRTTAGDAVSPSSTRHRRLPTISGELRELRFIIIIEQAEKNFTGKPKHQTYTENVLQCAHITHGCTKYLNVSNEFISKRVVTTAKFF